MGPKTPTWMNGIILVFSMLYEYIGSTSLEMELGHNTSLLLDQLLQKYDKRLRPGFGGPPLVVDVNLNIRSMGPISEIDMAYQMDCYFRQSWVDERLQFGGPLDIIQPSVNIMEKLWKPDTHFVNGKKSYLHVVTTPNKLLRINKQGRILYSMRLTIKASCPMHLENFPMDTQACPLRFGSHGYGVDDIQYIWTHGAAKSIKMASDMRLSQFDLIGHPAGNETAVQPQGLHSYLIAEFLLQRHMGHFLINVYVPCTMLVILSWVGFWINREATGDRIALGTFSYLSATFTLKRHMGYFLINIYVPCSMMVILSWVGFWINREATSDRIALATNKFMHDLEPKFELPEPGNHVGITIKSTPLTDRGNYIVLFPSKTLKTPPTLNQTGECLFLLISVQYAYISVNSVMRTKLDTKTLDMKSPDVCSETEKRANTFSTGITTVLTMAFLGIDNRRDLPQVSYSTALDYFLGMCFAFVLATIIQFASVHFFTKNGSGEVFIDSDEEDEAEMSQRSNNGRTNARKAMYYMNKDRRCIVAEGSANGQTNITLHYADQDLPTVMNENCCVKFYNCLKGSASYRDMKMRTALSDTNSVSRIDQTARALFPAAFITFHVFYWASYLHADDEVANRAV